MRNTFGNIFTLTTFGESHGEGVGGVVDGMPPGIKVDMDFIQHELDRRRPGQSAITTARSEADRVELLSGVFEGHTTGCPIGFLVRNQNQHSSDYDNLRTLFRPSHADYTYYQKYGIRDHRGGGRSSARITISRVVGGALAKLALQRAGISITAYTSQVGSIALDHDYRQYDIALAEQNSVRCPDPEKASQMEQLIGFEYGEGFACATCRGSELNDVFVANGKPNDNGKPPVLDTMTNHSGGIQGGISNGQDIYMRIAFKPVATLLRDQSTVDLQGNPITFTAHGRHDPCVLPRAVPVVEAMAAMTILDSLLQNKTLEI